MTKPARLSLVAHRLFRAALAASALVLLVAGPAPAAPSRIVKIDDANGDGRYTGADVDAAIVRCKPGCVLQALAVTYDDVEVTVGQNMPDGLIFEGAGIGKTIFRAPVPQLRPVIRVAEAPPNVVLRDFTVDGRMSEQTTAALSGEGTGIAISSLSGLSSPPGIVEHVEAANLLRNGIFVRNGSGWEIRNSLIHHIGCNLDFPCQNVVQPTPDPHVDGRKTTGFGVSITDSGANGTVVHHNTIWNVTKMGIEAYNYAAGQPPSDFWFHHNTVRGAAEAGIGANGGVNGRIENNLVENSGGSGIRGNSGAGLFCAGTSRYLTFTGNTARGNEGPGLRLGCQGPVAASTNVVQGNCRKALGNYGEMTAASATGGNDDLLLSTNSVLRGADGGGCAYALIVDNWSDVVVDGGSYQGGNAGVHLTRASNVTFRNASIGGGDGAGIYIQPSVNGVSVESTVQITHPNGLAVNNTGAQNVTVAASDPVAPHAVLSAPGKPGIKIP